MITTFALPELPFQPAIPFLFERSNFTIKIYPDSDFAEFIIKGDTVFDDRAALKSKKILEEARPGKKYYLLVSSSGFFKITKRARRLGADRLFSSHLAAVACYTGNFSLFLLGELYNKLNKPFVTTRVFPSREPAMEWLTDQMVQRAVPGISFVGAGNSNSN
jgi:hypothetical protein